MATKEIKINRWDLGMTEEERDLADGYFRYLENVSCGDKARGLKQVPNTTASSSTRELRRIINLNSTYYGLGADGSGDACIWKYSGSWASSTPAANYALADKQNPFFLHNNGVIYFDNLNHIGTYTVSGGAMVGDWSALTGGLKGGLMWQGNMYGWGTNNQIYKVVVTAPTSMIQIPTDQVIVDTLDYRNLQAVICTSSLNQCNMYLWDGVTTTSFHDIIRIGKGTVKGASILNGVITVVIAGANNKDFRIKQFNGTEFKTVYYYSGRKNTGGTINTTIISEIKESKGYIYFLVRGTRPNTAETHNIFLCRYGQKESGRQNSFCVYKDFNYIPTYTGGIVADFIILDDSTQPTNYVPVFAVVMDTDAYLMKEIITSGTSGVYTAQAGIIETGIFTGGDSSIEKQLKGISLQYAPLPTAGQVVVKYKKDEETTWTTIYTDTTNSAVSHESVNIESSGANLPTYKEIAFRIELLGEAEVTGLKFKYEETNQAY